MSALEEALKCVSVAQEAINNGDLPKVRSVQEKINNKRIIPHLCDRWLLI